MTVTTKYMLKLGGVACKLLLIVAAAFIATWLVVNPSPFDYLPFAFLADVALLAIAVYLWHNAIDTAASIHAGILVWNDMGRHIRNLDRASRSGDHFKFYLAKTVLERELKARLEKREEARRKRGNLAA